MSRTYYTSADNKNFFPELPIIYSGDWNNRTIWLLAIKVTVLTSAVPGLCRDEHGGLIFQICQTCEAEQLQCSHYTEDSLFLPLTSTFQDFSYLNALHQWSYSIIKGKNFKWNMNAEWLCRHLFWKQKSPSKLESHGVSFLFLQNNLVYSCQTLLWHFLTVVYIYKLFWQKMI